MADLKNETIDAGLDGPGLGHTSIHNGAADDGVALQQTNDDPVKDDKPIAKTDHVTNSCEDRTKDDQSKAKPAPEHSENFDRARRLPKFTSVVEAASSASGKTNPMLNRSASAMARHRWGLVNKHIKRNTSTFFGINTEGGDHHLRWEHRRRRLASKRCGPLKPEGFSRQPSSVSGTRWPMTPGSRGPTTPATQPPPAFLSAVDAFSTAASVKSKGHPRLLQRYTSDPLARHRIMRLHSVQSHKLEDVPEAPPSEGMATPYSAAGASTPGIIGTYRGLRPKDSVAKMAWERLSQKARPSSAKLNQVPTARQVLEHARSFKPSSIHSSDPSTPEKSSDEHEPKMMWFPLVSRITEEDEEDLDNRCRSLVDDFPPPLPSEKPTMPTVDEDAVDGELFFDITSTPPVGSDAGYRHFPGGGGSKSAKVEVGGKGLPGGGVWKVSDKPRSGPHGAFGEEDPQNLERIEGRLERFMDTALQPPQKRQLGMGVVGRLLNRPMRSQSRVASDIRQQLEDIDDHRPFFTYWATFVQVLIMVITLAVYGFAPLGFERKLITGTVQTTNLALEQVSYHEQQSFWLGPRSSDLIHLGAKYAPCMRRDEKIWKKVTQCREREKDSGCCILNDGGGCVQKYKSTDCSKTLAVFHKWRSGPRSATSSQGLDDPSPPCIDSSQNGPLCEKRISGPVCGQDPSYCESPPSVGAFKWADDITKWPVCTKPSVHVKALSNAPEHMRCEVVGHPCCVGIKGQCRITTREHCEFLRGYYHDEATLCSQVSCLDDVCGMISFLDSEKPDQVYRLWTSLFLHGGLLHLIITVIFQYVVMRDLEKMAGPVRIGIIYIGSGLAGNLASCIFLPYQAEVGPSGSQFGLLACLFVEVLQSWPLLLRPWRALGKLVLILLFLFILGLLPWVDNYSHLFGFIFGFLLSFTVLPYVSFGEFDRRRKIITIVACTVCTLGMFAALIILFYVTPVYECEGCSYFNCIPFTKHFCEDMEVEVKLEVEECE